MHAAIAEFRALGRAEFLTKYGLENSKSRDDFLWHEGVLIDSKPILSVAFGYQHPDHGPLDVGRMYGGVGGGAAVSVLNRLGFQTVTRAQLAPPQLGEDHDTRTAIQDIYGGDSNAGIMRFPGETVVNVFSDAQGPYADDPPSLAAPFGYRGEGLNGPQKLTQGGAQTLPGLHSSRGKRSLAKFAGRSLHMLRGCAHNGTATDDSGAESGHAIARRRCDVGGATRLGQSRGSRLT